MKPIEYLKSFMSACLLGLVVANGAAACPDIDGLVDVKCDGKVLIVTFGDSITQGYLDTKKLGYPGRLAKLLKHVEVVNLGRRGEDSRIGRNRALIELNEFPDADYIILQEGANDYYDQTPSAVELKENLLRMIEVAKSTKAYVLVGNLLATKRAFQREWVYVANREIEKLVYIDFNSLGTEVIGFDGLHPLPEGYQAMAQLVKIKLKHFSKKIKPKDYDNDGLYDYEEIKLRTNKNSNDTDRDGILDGKEVWRYKTNPRKADTDGDSIKDGDEINLTHTDPLIAESALN